MEPANNPDFTAPQPLNGLCLAILGAGGGMGRLFTRQARRAGTRAPKIALPTRTWVAPSAIAVSKSALIPIDSPESPLACAIDRSRRKCGPQAGRSLIASRTAPFEAVEARP